MPQTDDVTCEGLQLGTRWQGWRGCPCFRERLFCLGECGKALFPTGLEVAGDEAVLRFAGMEGTLSSCGFVPGSFHGQFAGAATALTPVSYFVGSSQAKATS